MVHPSRGWSSVGTVSHARGSTSWTGGRGHAYALCQLLHQQVAADTEVACCADGASVTRVVICRQAHRPCRLQHHQVAADPGLACCTCGASVTRVVICRQAHINIMHSKCQAGGLQLAAHMVHPSRGWSYVGKLIATYRTTKCQRRGVQIAAHKVHPSRGWSYVGKCTHSPRPTNRWL